MELLTRETALERLASVDWQPKPLLDMLLLAQAEALEWAAEEDPSGCDCEACRVRRYKREAARLRKEAGDASRTK